jgi:hypothetical protein
MKYFRGYHVVYNRPSHTTEQEMILVQLTSACMFRDSTHKRPAHPISMSAITSAISTNVLSPHGLRLQLLARQLTRRTKNHTRHVQHDQFLVFLVIQLLIEKALPHIRMRNAWESIAKNISVLLVIYHHNWRRYTEHSLSVSAYYVKYVANQQLIKTYLPVEHNNQPTNQPTNQPRLPNSWNVDSSSLHRLALVSLTRSR